MVAKYYIEFVCLTMTMATKTLKVLQTSGGYAMDYYLRFMSFTKRSLDRIRKKRGREMNPNIIALLLIPAIPVGAIGGIMAMSGLGFGGTFGFIYSMFIFIFIIAYIQGSNDYHVFIEANTEKKSLSSPETVMQKLDAIQDLLLQCKSSKGPIAGIIPENMGHEKNGFVRQENIR
jgi:hypothetical protein